MSDLIELPTPHRDPRAQAAYLRERAALAENMADATELIDTQPDADTLKLMLGLVAA